MQDLRFMSAGMLCHVDWYIVANFGWLVLPLSLGSSAPRKSRNVRPTIRNMCGGPRSLFVQQSVSDETRGSFKMHPESL